MRLLMVVPLLLFATSCKQDRPLIKFADSLSVGMSYDEVIAIKGRPVSISRGMRIVRLNAAEIRYLERTETEVLKGISPRVGMALHQNIIETRDEAKYVRWEYPPYQGDTLYVDSSMVFLIDKSFAINFDAASGRVVSFGVSPDSSHRIPGAAPR